MGPVLHIVTNLEPGGAQTSVAHIARDLRGRGVDAHIAFSSRGGVMPDRSGRLVDALAAWGVPLHDVTAMRRSPSPWDAVALHQLGELLRRLRPALVHTHASKAGALGRVAAARAGIPRVVHSVRGWAFDAHVGARRRLYVGAERRLAGLARRLVAVSPALVDAGVRHGIGRRGDYRIIRSGIELARFTEPGDRAATRRALGIPAEARVLGTVMHLVPAKAPLDLVAIAARIAAVHDDVHVVVVGDGPGRGALERAIAGAGLAARCHLVGLRDDVPALIRALDVFVLTSRWEGMPRVIVEAAASGVAIAATDVGGTRDIVVDGQSGFLCAPGDIDGLTRAVSRLLADRALAARLAAAARSRVTADFALARVVDEHVALYGELGLRA
jgi:glycosyltransferase involved in cell wall biosynthesis